MIELPVVILSAVTNSNWLTALVTLGAVVAGWFLNELSFLLRARREDRRSINRALCELMEVRHQLNALPAITKELKKKLPIPSQAEFALRIILQSLLPNADGLQKRYEDAVTSLSGAFPVLAYELRSKDIARPLLQRLRALLQPHTDTHPLWPRVEDELVQVAIHTLDETISRLARHCGRRVAREARSHLQASFEMPQEFDTVFAQLVQQAQQAAKSEGAGAVANPATD
jgi:hypothetical protein